MFIRLQTSSGVPITRQIGDQIRTLIASGTLQPGERLPSVRELAKELTVNQNTVLRVYERLTFEGLLERRHGDGTYVADRVPRGQMEAQRAALRDEISRLTEKARALGIGKEELRRMLDEAMRVKQTEAKP
jgi:GntR family transcriptional regulator